jgi:hypothetical protein
MTEALLYVLEYALRNMPFKTESNHSKSVCMNAAMENFCLWLSHEKVFPVNVATANFVRECDHGKFFPQCCHPEFSFFNVATANFCYSVQPQPIFILTAKFLFHSAITANFFS